MSKHKNHDSVERIDVAEVTAGDAQPGAFDAGGSVPAGAGRGESPAMRGEADARAAAELEAAKKAAADANAKVAVLDTEVSSLKDQYLRKLADYENFRKRMFREKEDAVKYANSQILGDLVTVMDDFDRAVGSSEQSRDFSSLHDGVDMIRKGLFGLLESKYGLERFDSVGASFDPNLHEAVMSEQGDCEAPLVVEEFIKGYRLRDRVLRSAKVKVRMPRSDGAANDEHNAEAKA